MTVECGETMPRGDGAEHRKISKFLSRVLRHQPQSIGPRARCAGLGRDRHADPVRRDGRHGADARADPEVVAESDKQRFALDATGRRIRANQGHSVDIDLGLDPSEPPAVAVPRHGRGQHRRDPRRGAEAGAPSARASVPRCGHCHGGGVAPRAPGRAAASPPAACGRPASRSCGRPAACGSPPPCRPSSSRFRSARCKLGQTPRLRSSSFYSSSGREGLTPPHTIAHVAHAWYVVVMIDLPKHRMTADEFLAWIEDVPKEAGHIRAVGR